MKLTEKQIEVAVEWWGNILRNPKFQTLSPRERSDPGSRPAALAEVLATASHKSPDEEKIERFKNSLRDQLSNGEVYLSVDYHPCRPLAAALGSAGIDAAFALPWKTSMNFHDGGVKVSCGYGEPYEKLL